MTQLSVFSIRFFPIDIFANKIIEPTEDEYLYWKKMLQLYMKKAKVGPENELDVLLSQCGAKAFTIVTEAKSYAEAIQILDGKFLKKTSSIMQRHKLKTRKQKEGEPWMSL